MPITQTREVARADMNDEYGVTCWQDTEMVDLTPDEARSYAHEIIRAADEADAAARDDRESFHGGTVTIPITSHGFDRDVPEDRR